MPRTLFPYLFEQFDIMNDVLNSCNSESCFNPTVYENEESFFVNAPVPGVKVEDIEVVVDRESKMLSINATAKQAEPENVQLHLKGASCFKYQIPLPQTIDGQAPVQAKCADGVLYVTLAKSKQRQPVKVEVRAA